VRCFRFPQRRKSEGQDLEGGAQHTKTRGVREDKPKEEEAEKANWTIANSNRMLSINNTVALVVHWCSNVQ